MSAKYTFLAWDTPIDNAPLKLALLQLANNSDDNGFSYYSISKMAKACGMSERTFMRKIAELEAMKVLTVERRANRSSLYKLIGDEMGVTLCHLQSVEVTESHLQKSQVTESHPEVTESHPQGDRESHDPNSIPNTTPESIKNNDSPKGKSNDYPDEFEWIWANKPQREGGNPKKQAYSACKARLKEGVTWRELAEGLNRYRAYCIAKRIVNTSTVQQMSTFFGTKESFKESWTVNHEATINNGSSSQPSQNATSRVSAALEKQRAEFNGSSEAMGNTDGVLHGQVHQEERGGSFIDLDNGDWSSK
ncbi:hypothetical protein VPHD96A_0040 [Vibrio phage D96a]